MSETPAQPSLPAPGPGRGRHDVAEPDPGDPRPHDLRAGDGKSRPGNPEDDGQFGRSVDPVHDAVARAGCGAVVGLFVAFVASVRFWSSSLWVPAGIVAAHVLVALAMRRNWWRRWPRFLSWWS